MEPFKTVDFNAAEANLEKLKLRGKVSPAEYRRMKKGISRVQSGQDQGFAYDVDSKNNSFTAKNESGQDARGKIGGVSGMNVLEGRKTSKALGYLSKFTTETPTETAPSQTKQAVSQPTASVQTSVQTSTVAPPKPTEEKKPVFSTQYLLASAEVDKGLKNFNPKETADEISNNPYSNIPATPRRPFAAQFNNTNVEKKNQLNLSPEELNSLYDAQSKTFTKKSNPIVLKEISETEKAFENKKKTLKEFEAIQKAKNEAYHQKIKDKNQAQHNAWMKNASPEEIAAYEKRYGKQAQTRGDLEKLKEINKKLNSFQNQNGGKVPMGEYGFKIQPFKPRTFNNGFISPANASAGNFKVNPDIKNKFLTEGVQPLPKVLTETPAISYLRKNTIQPWANYKPNQFEASAQTGPLGEGLNKFTPPAFKIGNKSDYTNSLVDIDQGMPNQNRAPKTIDKFGAINTALGVSSFARNLFRKEPQTKPTPEFRDKIRPYSGDQEQLDATLSGINQEAQRAANDVKTNAGNSVTSYLTGRSMIQANTNSAKANAYGIDGQIRRADRDRFDQQTSRENEINYNNLVNDQRAKEARAFQNYDFANQTDMATTQASLGYANAKNADIKNKEVALRQVEERMKNVKDAGKYNVLYGAIARGGLENLTPELRAVYDELFGVATGEKGMKISYFKTGGKIDMTPEKILAGANKDLKAVMLTYSKFVADASQSEMKDFRKYIRQINNINRVNIKRS